ncbi:MAG: type II and III secretion system protein [Verrucomicrobia bacterium]|nr:type II and III secretion system protein [Verrucomicrobiota bacterium]
MAEREIARRQGMATTADGLLRKGDQAYSLGDYENAVRDYRGAVANLPESDYTRAQRAEAVNKFMTASVKLAEQRIVEGRYPEAEQVLKVVLRPEFDPNYRPAVTLLRQLEDPQYHNRTIGPKFIAKVEQVKKLLQEAQGFYDTGRFDLSFKRYEQVLALDPTNTAARRGQEKVQLARTRYQESAYNEARGRALWEVAKGWENPVRKYGVSRDPRLGVTRQRSDVGTEAINRKLQTIVVPLIEFRNTTVRDAIEFLRQESIRLDNTEENADARGVNIFLKLNPGGPRPVANPAPAAAVPGADANAIPGLEPAPADATAAAPAAPAAPAASPETRITLSLRRLPLLEALRYVATAANLKVKVEPFAVAIVPVTENTDALITAEFRVPPNFINSTVTPSGGALNAPARRQGGGAGGGDVSGAGAAQITRASAQEFLQANGVVFPTGASATFLPASSKLVVRNTQENIDLIETLVQQAAGDVIKQVEIEAKFIEITQNNAKELSFDWLLGSFNGPGKNQKVFFGGGDGASQPGSPLPLSGYGANTPVGAYNVTNGNRSGGLAISGNAIDALLFGTAGAPAAAAPGIFSVAGVFTDPQFQVVIRALNQKKGVDLLSAPRVTTKSGQKATIEIVREFLYPTQFQPPQIPQNFRADGGTTIIPAGTGTVGVSSVGSSFPVTPTTPTNFEKRNTGVTLEVEPVVGPDGFTIDLNLQPQVVEFDGFINYGSPIQTTSTNLLGQPVPIVLTPNVINQPIFSTRKVTTSVSIYDGSTVVLGGLVREDVQRVRDKVPVLGDIPLVGRLFRSEVDSSIKRNLIIFVTAKLIDPAGAPLISKEEEEETIEPLTGPDYVKPPVGLPLFPKK